VSLAAPKDLCARGLLTSRRIPHIYNLTTDFYNAEVTIHPVGSQQLQTSIDNLTLRISVSGRSQQTYIAMSDAFGARTLKRKNVKGLALNKPPPRPTAAESNQQAEIDELAGRTQQLEIGIEYKLDLKREDLEVLKELGSGNGGTVSKVRHIATGTIMARKVQT
jgi:hypothetical protein